MRVLAPPNSPHPQAYLLHSLVHQRPLYKCFRHLLSTLVCRNSTYRDPDRPPSLKYNAKMELSVAKTYKGALAPPVIAPTDISESHLSKCQVEGIVAIPRAILKRHRGCHVLGKHRTGATWHCSFLDIKYHYPYAHKHTGMRMSAGL